LNKLVNEVLSWTMSTSVEITVSLLLDSTSWRVESEWEEEVVNLLELGSKAVDLVDDVLDAFDSVLSETLLDDLVLDQGDSLSVELSVSSLVDEGLDGVLGWESVGDIWLDLSEHVHRGLVVLDENSVADFGKSEKGEDFSLFWSDLGKTLDSDDYEELVLLVDEKLVVLEGFSFGLNELGLFLVISLGVFLSLG
jgi:hypothetical protein